MGEIGKLAIRVDPKGKENVAGYLVMWGFGHGDGRDTASGDLCGWEKKKNALEYLVMLDLTGDVGNSAVGGSWDSERKE
jgi:hypothetical protein